MSVATFNNNMMSLVCEIDDRKIYNDIRSQIDITVTTVILDAPAEYAIRDTRYDWDERNIIWSLAPYETKTVYLYTRKGDYVITCHRAWAWDMYLTTDYKVITREFDLVILATYSDKIYVSVTNPWNEELSKVWLMAEYTYQSFPALTHPETNIKTVTVQTQDNASILKYGRRTMSLVWPLGQTQQQMESLAEYYKQLYKEPKAYLSMTLQGKNDTLIQQILTVKISDRVTVINDRLGLNGDFFINSVDIFHDCHGLLIGDYSLEEIATIQSATLFKLDVSLLDGPHILG